MLASFYTRITISSFIPGMKPNNSETVNSPQTIKVLPSIFDLITQQLLS